MNRRYMITLFSTNCPKCKILEKKLTQKNIPYTINYDIDEIIDKGYMTVPILKVDNNYMDFGLAVKWVNNISEDNNSFENFDCKSCEV